MDRIGEIDHDMVVLLARAPRLLSGLIALIGGAEIPITNEVIAAIDAELELQRRLSERHEVERDLMETQLQFAATLQADLDALRVILQSAAPFPRPEHPTDGNGHDQETAGGQ